MNRKKYDYYIGIDPGVNTGIGIWVKIEKSIEGVYSMKIHEAIEMLRTMLGKNSDDVLVRVEDARKRKWYGNNSNAKAQGAGSVKRDCRIWEDFLTDLGVDFEMTHPIKNATKLNAKQFKETTGYLGRTNEHGRDAAMLVYGM